MRVVRIIPLLTYVLIALPIFGQSNESHKKMETNIILYQGKYLVIYYSTNSWNFTRIGKIDNADVAQLKSALGRGDVTVTLSSGR